MTCIVGIEWGGVVWLGGDSSCLDEDGDAVVTQRQSKVFRRGPYVIGFAGSFQVGDLLKYQVQLPKKITKDHPRQISEAVQEAFKTAKITKPDTWSALIGYESKLYVMQEDFYCYSHSKPYAVIGASSAVAVALGTLCTLDRLGDKSKTTGRARIKMALENASQFSSNVRDPWKFTKTLDPK